MITWMQRHKKWLVITIWISTIAFVGAGFVGWGSYDYGKQGGVVAVVGDREVSIEEYQQEYSSLYEQYANLFGTTFNQEMADRLNLKDVAYNQVIQKNLILSYADSLGLDVTDEDVAKQLVKYEAFLKDGKFDKQTYIKVLNQNRMKPVDFEDSLKRNILLQKVQTLFELKPTKQEIESLNKLLFLEDEISYKVLDVKDIKVDVTNDEVKKYWEKNKDSYLSEVTYDLEIETVPLTSSNPSEEEIKAHYDKFKMDYKKEDGKLKTLDEAKVEVIKALDEKATKTQALKKYLKIKKNEEKLSSKQIVEQSKLPYKENNAKILEAKNADIIKPFLHENSFVIVKVAKKIDASPLSFEKALNQVKADYLKIAKDKKLDEVANSLLKKFEGKKATVSRESVNKISDLSQQDAANFLRQLFASTTKEGVIKLEDKSVLYKVLNSKFTNYDNTKDEMVKTTLTQIQEQELMTNFVKRLENMYEIQSSIQTKEQ